MGRVPKNGLGAYRKHTDDINLYGHTRNLPHGDLTESVLGLGDTEPRPWFEFEMGEEVPCGGENQNIFVSVKER
jgi:hypothetical protein